MGLLRLINDFLWLGTKLDKDELRLGIINVRLTPPDALHPEGAYMDFYLDNGTICTVAVQPLDLGRSY